MMKKISTFFIILVLAVVLVSRAEAQLQVGTGMVYGSEINLVNLMLPEEMNTIGIQANAVFNLTPSFRATADLAIYVIDEGAGIDKDAFREFNINGHFLLPVIPKVNIYGLAGVHFATSTLVIDEFNIDVSEMTPGLNIGVGVEWPIRFVHIFGEAKNVLQVEDGFQPFFTTGVRYAIVK